MDLQLTINVGQLILAGIGGITMWWVRRLIKDVDEATKVTRSVVPVLRTEVLRNTADIKILYKRTDRDTQRIAALEQK
jgi:hypothetical protein|tara:strand:+ start:278 stop:511 length:234 start_codon:yes stop_codon:yes gene_type:complete